MFADFDVVRAGLEVEVLERAVEIVDSACVVAVRVDGCVFRRVGDADAAVRALPATARDDVVTAVAVAIRDVPGVAIDGAVVSVWVVIR